MTIQHSTVRRGKALCRFLYLIGILLVITCPFVEGKKKRKRRRPRRIKQQCNYLKLERKLASEMHEMFEEMFLKWGCHGYSDLKCRKDDSNDFSCRTGKSVHVPNGPQCRVDILEDSVERKITKMLGKAESKYGCTSDQVTCKMALDGWTKCSVTGGKREGETPEYDVYEDAPNSKMCDIRVLRGDVEHDIAKELWSSQDRYGCPQVKRVLCLRQRGSRQITCKVSILEESKYLESCDMSYVTRELSEEVGESFLSAQYKYGCQLPRRMDCSVDEDNRVSCDLRRLHYERRRQDTAYEPADEHADDPIDEDFSATEDDALYENDETDVEAEIPDQMQNEPDGTSERGSSGEKLLSFAAKYSLRGRSQREL